MEQIANLTRADTKYLTFELGAETYGLPILKVKEIIRMMDITNIPRTPSYMKGVINLRGKVVPIIDLRLKLGLSDKPYNERTCIIIVDVAAAKAAEAVKARRFIGFTVDIVSEVASIPTEKIKPPPECDTSAHQKYLTGITTAMNKIIMFLDIEQVLRMEEPSRQ